MKKKNIFKFIILLVLCIPMMSISATTKVSCGNVNGIPEKIPELTNLFITIVQVAVPVILVIMGMMDLVKGITAQKEDEVKKGQQMFIKRLIVGGLIFFIVVIAKLVVSIIAGDNTGNIVSCIDCFLNNGCNPSAQQQKKENTYVCVYGDTSSPINLTMVKGESNFQLADLNGARRISIDNWDKKMTFFDKSGKSYQLEGTCPSVLISFQIKKSDFDISTHYIVGDSTGGINNVVSVLNGEYWGQVVEETVKIYSRTKTVYPNKD